MFIYELHKEELSKIIIGYQITFFFRNIKSVRYVIYFIIIKIFRYH